MSQYKKLNRRTFIELLGKGSISISLLPYFTSCNNIESKKELVSYQYGIGIHHHIKKYKNWTLSHNLIVSLINDVSSENGNQSLILGDINLELESNKFLGFGYRTNIGFRMHDTRSWYYNEEYRKLHNVWVFGYHVGNSGGPGFPYSSFYASFSILALTFGS